MDSESKMTAVKYDFDKLVQIFSSKEALTGLTLSQQNAKKSVKKVEVSTQSQKGGSNPAKNENIDIATSIIYPNTNQSSTNNNNNNSSNTNLSSTTNENNIEGQAINLLLETEQYLHQLQTSTEQNKRKSRQRMSNVSQPKQENQIKMSVLNTDIPETPVVQPPSSNEAVNSGHEVRLLVV